MTYKQFQRIKIFVAMALAAIVGQAILTNNYLLSLGAATGAFGLIIFLKKRVKEVMADERDYKIAGDAARYAMIIFSGLGTIGGFVLMSLRETNASFALAGAILAYGICALMLLYSFIYMYFNHSLSLTRRVGTVIAIGIIVAFFVVSGLRFFGPEDAWFCEDNVWVKHGNPSAPKPEIACAETGVKENTAWQDIVTAVENCAVKAIMQTHNLAVTAELKDGRKLSALEEDIDDIFAVVLASREKCGSIIMATE